jgi:N-acetyl-anhydromuramyl-L-alanine amidase AmpD
VEATQFIPTFDYKDLRSFGQRKPQSVILHYTAIDSEHSRRALKGNVSAHYLVHPDGKTDLIVGEAERAWHAGLAKWGSFPDINSASIGIEIVGFGYWNEIPEKAGLAKQGLITVTGSDKEWFPYPEAQMNTVATICKDLKQRWNIRDELFLGHSDIAPGRKVDPGPLFPWEWLHKEHNIGAWVGDLTQHPKVVSLPSEDQQVTWMQMKLRNYGYDCSVTGTLDAATSSVIQSFQMHYCPSNISGLIDEKTIKTLALLLERYHYKVQSD